MFLTLIFCWCFATVLGITLPKGNFEQFGLESGRIIGGQAVYAGQLPFLGALNIRTTDGAYFCGCSLLTTQWATTAGHCVNGAILLSLQFGSYILDDSISMTLTTDLYILHPEYNALTLANDIGLIEFRMPIYYSDYIKPIDILPTTVLSDNSFLLTMGWGQASDSDGSIQSIAKCVWVTNLSNDLCKEHFGNQILDTMTCAKGNYNQGICYGDTGSPLVQYHGRGVMLVGIASFISQNGCESVEPSGYTRVFTYVDWIVNNTGFVEDV